MTIGPKPNAQATTKPVDLSLIKQKYGTWKKIKLLLGQVDAARMPVRTSRELKTLDAHQLRDLLAKERVALTTNKRSTIVFIDCQHEKNNEKFQISGAIHMNLASPTGAVFTFKNAITSKSNVYSKIGAADLVVFYCSVAEERSPTMMALYQDAVLKPENRPLGYNDGQVVRLLAGGIKAYKELTDEVIDGVPVNDDVPFLTTYKIN
ncbi:unnamed protein product [Penicillium pancosmium]